MNDEYIDLTPTPVAESLSGLSAQRSDREIVELFLDRDERALEAASSKYGRYISAVAMNVLGDRQDAEECVNDALMKAWESIPPATPSNLGGFLAKIAKNVSLNRYRREHSEKRGGGELTGVYEELRECVASGDSVERNYENKELIAAVNAFLGKLPSDKRDIFVLRYWYCMSVAELSKRVGISENRAAVELFRLRKRLVKYLQKRGYQYD